MTESLTLTDDPSTALLGVATLAHELEGPFAAIEATLERLRRTCTDGGALAAVADLEQHLRRARRYVAEAEEALGAPHEGARPSGGARVLDLRAVVREAVEACVSLAEAGRTRLALTDLPEADLPVAADADRLHDAVRAVVHNACKFTRGGVVRVNLRTPREGDRVEVEISDTGLGMTPAERQRLFTPFYRTPAARAQDPDGRGLGLAHARRTVEQHGGDLHVASEGPGRGTLVTLRLPLTRPPRTTVAAAALARAPRRVLVVEDWAELGEVFGELLRNQGLEVHVVLDGASALDVAARLRPDLVFLDLGLPDVPGAEVGRRLRVNDPRVVLVALTGRSDHGEGARCLAAGFDHYAVKPMRIETLEEVLALVEQRRAAAR